MPFRSRPAYFKVRSIEDPTETMLLGRQNRRWVIAMLHGDETAYMYGRLLWTGMDWSLMSGE